MDNSKKNKLERYLSNLGKSVKELAPDVAKSLAPETSEKIDKDIENIKNKANEIEKSLNKILKSSGNTSALKGATKGISDGVKNITDALKTGRIYDSSKNEQMQNAIMSGISGMDMDDFNMDDLGDMGDLENLADSLDMSGDGDESGFTVNENSFINNISAPQTSVIHGGTTLNNTVDTGAMMAIANVTGAVGQATLGAISETNTRLDSVIEFNTEHTAEFQSKVLEATESKLELLKDINDKFDRVIKVMVDPEDPTSGGRRGSLYDGSKFNLDLYLDNIRKNIENKTSSALSMLGMLNITPEGIKTTIEGLLKDPLTVVVKQATTMAVQKVLDTVSVPMISMFNNWYKYGNFVQKKIGEWLGVRSNISTGISGIKVDNKPVPFDGYTRRSIVEVIPNLLTKINSSIKAIKGYDASRDNTQEFFDFTKGRFSSGTKLRSDLIKSTTSDIDGLFKGHLDGMMGSSRLKGMDNNELQSIRRELLGFMMSASNEGKSAKKGENYFKGDNLSTSQQLLNEYLLNEPSRVKSFNRDVITKAMNINDIVEQLSDADRIHTGQSQIIREGETLNDLIDYDTFGSLESLVKHQNKNPNKKIPNKLKDMLYQNRVVKKFSDKVSSFSNWTNEKAENIKSKFNMNAPDWLRNLIDPRHAQGSLFGQISDIFGRVNLKLFGRKTLTKDDSDKDSKTGGMFGEAKQKLTDSINTLQDQLFGKDKMDLKRATSKPMSSDEIKANVKKYGKGGAFGLVGSLFMPFSALTGTVLGVVHQTEWAQDKLYNEKDGLFTKVKDKVLGKSTKTITDENGNKVEVNKSLMENIQTGVFNISNSVHKTLFGEMKDYKELTPDKLKENSKRYGKGAAVGVIGSLIFPVSTMTGALLGMAHQTDIVKESLYDKEKGLFPNIGRKLTDTIFGEKFEADQGEIRRQGGLFGKVFDKKDGVVTKINTYLFGDKFKESTKSSVGILKEGLFGEEGMFTNIGHSVKKYLFGKKDAEDESSIDNMNALEKLMNSTNRTIVRPVESFFKKEVIPTISKSMGAYTDEMQLQYEHFKVFTKDTFNSITTKLRSSVEKGMETSVGGAIKDTIDKYVVKPIKQSTDRVGGLLRKVIGSQLDVFKSGAIGLRKRQRRIANLSRINVDELGDSPEDQQLRDEINKNRRWIEAYRKTQSKKKAKRASKITNVKLSDITKMSKDEIQQTVGGKVVQIHGELSKLPDKIADAFRRKDPTSPKSASDRQRLEIIKRDKEEKETKFKTTLTDATVNTSEGMNKITGFGKRFGRFGLLALTAITGIKNVLKNGILKGITSLVRITKWMSNSALFSTGGRLSGLISTGVGNFKKGGVRGLAGGIGQGLGNMAQHVRSGSGVMGKAKNIAGLAGRGMRFIPGVGWIAMGASALSEGFSGWGKAGERFETEDPTMGQKVSSALGSALTLGMGGDGLSQAIYGVTKPFQMLVDTVKTGAKTISSGIEIVRQVLRVPFEIIKSGAKIVMSVGKTIGSVFAIPFKIIGAFFDNGDGEEKTKTLSEVVIPALNKAVDTFTKVIDKVVGGIQFVTNTLTKVIEAPIKVIDFVIKKTVELPKAVIKGITSPFVTLFNWLKEIVKHPIKFLKGELKLDSPVDDKNTVEFEGYYKEGANGAEFVEYTDDEKKEFAQMSLLEKRGHLLSKNVNVYDYDMDATGTKSKITPPSELEKYKLENQRSTTKANFKYKDMASDSFIKSEVTEAINKPFEVADDSPEDTSDGNNNVSERLESLKNKLNSGRPDDSQMSVITGKLESLKDTLKSGFMSESGGLVLGVVAPQLNKINETLEDTNEHVTFKNVNNSRDVIKGNPIAKLIADKFTDISELFGGYNHKDIAKKGGLRKLLLKGFSSTTDLLHLVGKAILGISVGGGGGGNVIPGGGASGPVSGSGELQGNDNAEKIWNFFKGKGVTDEVTAGIIGNLMQESRLDPTLHQSGGGPGRGLLQWEKGSDRFNGLVKYAQSKGVEWTDMQAQLEYMWWEMTHNDGNYNRKVMRDRFNGMTPEDFVKLTDVKKATEVFERTYERAGKPMMAKRQQFAAEAYSMLKGTSGGGGGPSTLDPATIPGADSSSSTSSSGGSSISESQIQGDNPTTSTLPDNSSGGGGATSAAPTAIKVAQGFRNLEGSLRYSMKGDRTKIEQGVGDCSSTVQWAYKKYAGVDVGGYTGAQLHAGRLVKAGPLMGGNDNTDSGLLPGDLLLYNTAAHGAGRPYGVSHVEMYLGDGKIAGHGGGPGGRVPGPTIKSFSSMANKLIAAKRIIDPQTGQPYPNVKLSGNSAQDMALVDNPGGSYGMGVMDGGGGGGVGGGGNTSGLTPQDFEKSDQFGANPKLQVERTKKFINKYKKARIATKEKEEDKGIEFNNRMADAHHKAALELDKQKREKDKENKSSLSSGSSSSSSNKGGSIIVQGDNLSTIEKEKTETVEYTNDVYIVKKGDWLGKIAQKYGTTVKQILADNPQITNKNLIYPGDKIKLRVPKSKVSTVKQDSKKNQKTIDKNDKATIESINKSSTSLETKKEINQVNKTYKEMGGINSNKPAKAINGENSISKKIKEVTELQQLVSLGKEHSGYFKEMVNLLKEIRGKEVNKQETTNDESKTNNESGNPFTNPYIMDKARNTGGFDTSDLDPNIELLVKGY